MQASLLQHGSGNLSGFFGARLPAKQLTCSCARHSVVPGRNLSLDIRADNVLIANTKGGGHAFIGLHLGRQLLIQGHRVTILNDGEPGKLAHKNPFKMYGRLEEMGAHIIWGNPSDPSTYPADDFQIVYDNNGKDLEACRPLIDYFKGKDLAHYVYVSSAGAYLPDPMEPCHLEGDRRKASAGHVEVEGYLQLSGLPWTVFQPLYIYGLFNAKDCEHWFLDRIMRNRPVPIPEPGIQLTSLTNVEDVAALLAKVPGNQRAVGQFYNLCGDRCITFVGLVKSLAAAAGKEADIVLYNPKDFKLKKGEGFPFRTVHFFASDVKAREELGFVPLHSIAKDAKFLVDDYVASGRLNKEVDFSTDDLILGRVKAFA